MGIQGRYITWAACAIGGAILGFIIVYCILGYTPRNRIMVYLSIPAHAEFNKIQK